jgi:hypothetical protein
MQKTHTITAGALALLLGVGLIAAPLSAQASEEGHRNTTYALGALSAFLLATQKNKLPGLLAAGGAAYAYTQWDRSIQERHAREAYYRDGYYRNGDNYRNGNYYRNGDYRNGDYYPRGTNYRPYRQQDYYTPNYTPNYRRNYDDADYRANYHRRYDDADYRGRHDNGKHRGWHKGKHGC